VNPAPRLLAWANGSLAARIVTLVLALLLLLQVASFGAIRSSLQSHAHDQLPGDLATADRVMQNLLNQQASKLAGGASVLVADDGFKTALATGDNDTIQSVLENHGRRIGASEVALLAPDFSLRVYSGVGERTIRGSLATLSIRLAGGKAGDVTPSEVVLIGQDIHQFVMVPYKWPPTVVQGWVLMGFPLGPRLVEDMRQLSSMHLTVLSRPRADARWEVSLSSLPGAKSRALSTRPWAPQPNPDEMLEVDAAGDTQGVRVHWLSGAAAAAGQSSAREGPSVVALVSASIDDAVRLPIDLQVSLLAITFGGFLAFGVLSVVSARRVTTPLRDLARAAERLGGGDYDTPMPRLRSQDEIGELAATFEHMRINVADKQAEVQKLAYWDSLTGLPNRVQFGNAVAEAIREAQAQGHGVAVLMLDLDRFKHVNDVLGYRLGDLLLTCLAERLKNQIVRDGDLVARLSGDEFAVLLRRGDAALAKSVAARIVRVFDEPLELEEHTVDMGAGVGMACWPEHATDAEQLLSRAEVAMYTAKRRTSGPLLYDASIDASSAQTLSLLSELRHAVDHGELRLFLQPKLALATGEVVGAETLVRWQHPTRGMVPPMQFIPFAEQTGFIRNLTMWIFEEAARHWTSLTREGISLTLSVNLSTRDLLDQDLPQKFGAMLARHEVPATAFCLEITESAIMDDPQRALSTLERLSDQGFLLSIDDFGTGYSSLAYLKRLPVDELKIDKSFVMGMEADQDDRKIVRSTIDLAHNLGLSVVAEGVENAKIWDLLRELHCDHAQGYHMGRPMPATEFSRWAEGWAQRHGGGQPAPSGLGTAAATGQVSPSLLH
jgi:diguanylate cyclase (GGDEF)-like protein